MFHKGHLDFVSGFSRILLPWGLSAAKKKLSSKNYLGNINLWIYNDVYGYSFSKNDQNRANPAHRVNWPPLVPTGSVAILSSGVQKLWPLFMVYLPHKRAVLTVCCMFSFTSQYQHIQCKYLICVINYMRPQLVLL